MAEPLDTNVVLRYLVDDPEAARGPFRRVVPFFQELERGERGALLTPLVIFQCWFVLTRHYRVPRREAAAALARLLGFRGLRVPDKPVMRNCLELLEQGEADLVDAWLAALCRHRGLAGVYSFDRGIERLGVRQILP